MRVTDVLISTQHAPGELDRVREYLASQLVPLALGEYRAERRGSG